MLIGMIVGADAVMENERSQVSESDVDKLKTEAKQEARADMEGHLRIITLTAVAESG